MAKQQRPGWTVEDFNVVSHFLNTIGVALNSESTWRECRELLQRECQEAKDRLYKITEAIDVYG